MHNILTSTKPRRTKIVATLGPATDTKEILMALLKAGTNVVRINCSHGTTNELADRIKLVRDAEQACQTEIAILLDLQGPKIRINSFKKSPVQLQAGQEFVLDAELSENAGDNTQVGIDYKKLPQDVDVDDILLLDDGRLSFKVKQVVNNKKIICEVINGGELSNKKGINKLGGGLSADALTDKDKQDIKLIASLDIDYVALSFPRSADDINQARDLLKQSNSRAGIIAKIERAEALVDIDEIINASNGIMVARGDLGVEIGDAELPAVQKRLIQRARALDKIVITATQMMESMIENLQPSRAEVFDVANAVLDGTDAVMLSAETAVGKHPIAVVEAMHRICLGAEAHHSTRSSKHRMECTFKRADEAIAMATMYTANHMNVRAIIVITETGATPLWMSRIRSGIPIYALSRFRETRLKLKLFRGVYPIEFDVTKQKRADVNWQAVDKLKSLNCIADNDWVVLARGDFLGVEGGCNTMKILRVGDIN